MGIRDAGTSIESVDDVQALRVESFLNIGRIYPEIAPIEKRIDMHIDLLRREEFRELECVSDAAKYVFLAVSSRMHTD